MNGTLLIVGGAELRSRPEIYVKFFELAGGANRPLVIIPAAGGDPESSYRETRDRLIKAGASEKGISCLQIAAHYEPWAGNETDADELAKLESAAGIWFTGGDQNLIVRSLVNPDGSDGPALTILRDRYAAGAVIGGTSAGAAVMSNPMIAGGTSFSALAPDRAAKEGAFSITPGLGFFRHGIVDQHFDARGRLGRLVMACLKSGTRRGFGIAEDTALVYHGPLEPLESVGSGGIIVIDTGLVQDLIRGIVLGYFGTGDQFDIAQSFIDPGDKRSMEGNEFFSAPLPVSSGVMSDHPGLAEFIARNLTDNDPTTLFQSPKGPYAKSYLIEGDPPSGFELRFHRTDRTRGWFGGNYAFEGVELDIVPIDLSITESGK